MIVVLQVLWKSPGFGGLVEGTWLVIVCVIGDRFFDNRLGRVSVYISTGRGRFL